jgi:hypothetical protein
MNENNILNFIATIKDFGFDDTSASAIFSNSSNLIHNKFNIVYK